MAQAVSPPQIPYRHMRTVRRTLWDDTIATACKLLPCSKLLDNWKADLSRILTSQCQGAHHHRRGWGEPEGTQQFPRLQVLGLHTVVINMCVAKKGLEYRVRTHRCLLRSLESTDAQDLPRLLFVADNTPSLHPNPRSQSVNEFI